MVDLDSENDISCGYDEGIDVEDTRGKQPNNIVMIYRLTIILLNPVNKHIIYCKNLYF